MWSSTKSVVLAVCVAVALGHAQVYPNQPPYGSPGGGAYPPGYQNTSHYGGGSYGGGFGGPNLGGLPGTNDLFRPLYEWFKIDYAWPDESLKTAALRASQYIPENNALAGIRVWRDRMFLTVPRWKEGVPATLTSVPAQPRGGPNSPRLEPFPSWDWQELGNCSALQNVHGIEIDSEGRMWVVDSGRVNTKGGRQENRCPPKLVIFDLNTAQFTDNYYNNGYNMNPSSGFPGPGSVFNDPNRPYSSNPSDPNYRPNSNPSDPNYRPYPNNPSDPNHHLYSNNPSDPNYRPYSSNPSDPNYRPYSSNPSDPNYRPYSSNPSDPNYRPYSSNPSDPNYRPYSSNPSDPNYRPYSSNPSDPNYRHGAGYDDQYNRNSGYGNNYGGHHGDSRYPDSNNQYGYSGNPLYRPSSRSRIRVIKSYTFPEEAAQRTSAMLNNIVLDSNDGWYAYITDSSDADPGIIVFSLAQSRSWKVRDSKSMRADPRTDSVTINGDRAEIQVNVAGIALSPSGRERMLYYAPLSSTRLFSLPTTALREPGRDIGGVVNDLGQKMGVSDGMIMDNNGALYFGVLGASAVARWDSHRDPFATGQRILATDRQLLQWPDSFAIDESGNLLVVTNRLQNFLRNRPVEHEPSYRVVRASMGVHSYLSGGGGTFGQGYRPNPGITGSFADDASGSPYDPYRSDSHESSRPPRDSPLFPQVYNYQTGRGSPCVGLGTLRPDQPCDDAHRFLDALSSASRQTWDSARTLLDANHWSPPAPAHWEGVSASVSSSGDSVIRHYHGGYVADDANSDYNSDPNYRQPSSYDVNGRNYDDPNNNLYDPNFRQPSSFDNYGSNGGAYGSSAYGRGYYGRYNVAAAPSAPLALLGTLLAAVLALGVFAERR